MAQGKFLPQALQHARAQRTCTRIPPQGDPLDEAVRSLKKGPFTLATEDEWEYLCNGGARTLFRWGDTLEGVLSEIYAVGAVGQDRRMRR